jgi:hypothetical protein
MDETDFSNDKKTGFIVGSGGRFKQPLIAPKGLRFNEIDPVFGLVGSAFDRIKLE